MLQGNWRVLLVEDSKLTAEQLCEMIQSLRPEINCVTVATEEDALNAIGNIPPHIVVLDLLLKQGSGFNVLRKISAMTPKPLVVVLTNYALPQYREYALLTGADYFLDKAVSIDVLPTILESFLRSAGSAEGPRLPAD